MKAATSHFLPPSLIASLVFCSLIGQSCRADEKQLSSVLNDAISNISEQKIRSTISFLASDELGGRDTPSPELTIASAFVASRFLGAGLEGGGEDGSFYQYAEVATQQFSTNVTLLVGEQSVEHFGLLSGSDENLDISGVPTNYESDANVDNKIVVMEAPDVADRRAEAEFRRELGKVSRAAQVVLLQVAPDHPFVSQAARKQRPTLVSTRRTPMGTVLLVPKMENSPKVHLKIPKNVAGKAEVRNVIGVLKGSDPESSQEAVIYSAHLDHIGKTSGEGDVVFNGADDDATGVTAVIALADAFGSLKTPPKRTVIFMTFWGEEKGLLGSRHYAKNPTWPLDKIVANVNLEMLGRPEGGAYHKCWMTGWQKSNLGELMRSEASKVGVEIFEHPRFSAMLYGASDNASFVREGVIAHSFSAGSLHEDYHQLGDHWQKLELGHMTKVIQGIFVGSYPIANGALTPSSR